MSYDLSGEDDSDGSDFFNNDKNNKRYMNEFDARNAGGQQMQTNFGLVNRY